MQRKLLTNAVLTALMGLFSLLFFAPLLWMFSAASKLDKDVMTYPVRWIPEKWNLIQNFKTVWMGKVPFDLFYWNSLKLSVLMTLCTLLFSSMAGFSFAKLRFPGKAMAFAALMSFFLIPNEATLVPRYIMIKWLGLYNTHESLILMGAFSIPLTFLMRQYMLGISHEFMEAAKIDGAGYFRTYWQLMLPLCKPILATVGILKFLWTWNDYQGPLIFLYNPKLFTITLGIQSFRDQYSDNYAALMMASLSAIVPLLLVFIVLQKQVVKGITVGGVKG
ncbi:MULTISPECIES: carbohydrate ABC transporter permease [Cohnella]|uniref:Multiple sugar transport system permease protein n=1 Tax=Cohnella phaseoli TaxID=456490 RepID=A0A3D9I903_9BACL|nr:carbohydrate ABC transporter permease [Cohnella phaseoli]RED58181.1 multiple sugar transport system permease protein [Cohnella phaseoli]